MTTECSPLHTKANGITQYITHKENEMEGTIHLTEEQGDFVIKAIEAYVFAISDVTTYQETIDRRKKIIDPIYEQMPDEWF